MHNTLLHINNLVKISNTSYVTIDITYLDRYCDCYGNTKQARRNLETVSCNRERDRLCDYVILFSINALEFILV